APEDLAGAATAAESTNRWQSREKYRGDVGGRAHRAVEAAVATTASLVSGCPQDPRACHSGELEMPNQLLTTDLIADRALMLITEKSTFLRTINREYDDSFANKAAKIGDTLRVPIPQHGKYRKGRVADPNPLQTITRNVTVFGQRGFEIEFSSAELALDIEEFERRYLSQQVADFVVNLEAEVLEMAVKATPNQTGPVNSAFTSANALWYANMAKKLIEDNGGFKGTKRMLLDNTAQLNMIDALKGLVNSQQQLKVQYEEGEMGRAAG